MALIVEDGTSKSDAESYSSVATADVYFIDRQGSVAWIAETVNANKEAALRNATTYLDLKYREKWLGVRVALAQSLAFPRVGLVDYDGWGIAIDAVPIQIVHACCEAAVLALSEDLLPDLAGAGTISEKSIGVGSIRSSTKFVGGQSQYKRYSKVHQLLKGFIQSGGMSIAMVRS